MVTSRRRQPFATLKREQIQLSTKRVSNADEEQNQEVSADIIDEVVREVTREVAQEVVYEDHVDDNASSSSNLEPGDNLALLRLYKYYNAGRRRRDEILGRPCIVLSDEDFFQ